MFQRLLVWYDNWKNQRLILRKVRAQINIKAYLRYEPIFGNRPSPKTPYIELVIYTHHPRCRISASIYIEDKNIAQIHNELPHNLSRIVEMANEIHNGGRTTPKGGMEE